MPSEESLHFPPGAYASFLPSVFPEVFSFGKYRRRNISRLEKEIAAAEAREAELGRLIAENPADFELVGECCTELEELKERHEKLLEEWIALD